MYPVFIPGEAEGAWPLGATVRKLNSLPGDSNPDGTLGTIMASFDVRRFEKGATYAYFVAWAHTPDLPIFVADTNKDGKPRLELVNASG